MKRLAVLVLAAMPLFADVIIPENERKPRPAPPPTDTATSTAATNTVVTSTATTSTAATSSAVTTTATSSAPPSAPPAEATPVVPAQPRKRAWPVVWFSTVGIALIVVIAARRRKARMAQ